MKAVSIAGLFFAMTMLTPAIADAQWEIEFHGGLAAVTSSITGSGSVPLPAATICCTITVAPFRPVSSWYFGDGALLLNQVNQQFAVGARITPLDSGLRQSAVARNTGPVFGFRVGYTIRPRLTVEMNVDLAQTPLKFADSLTSAVDASQTSFVAAWNGFLSTGPFTAATVTSVKNIHDEAGRQLFTTGALNINLKAYGRLIPYVTFGAGVVTSVGDRPYVTLVGRYQFTATNQAAAGTFPIDESDAVTVRVAGGSSLVTVFGGGFKRLLTPSGGVRVDVRVHISSAPDLLLYANPQSAMLSPVGSRSTSTVPALAFSNFAGWRTSLSGPQVADFVTIAGEREVRVGVSAGYFIRF